MIFYIFYFIKKMNNQNSLNIEYEKFKKKNNNATVGDFFEKKIFNDFDLNDSNIYKFHIKKDIIYDLKSK